MPVATDKSVDGLQKNSARSTAVACPPGATQHDSGGSGNSEGGRQGGVGGKPAGGKMRVNDPLTQPGVGGGKLLSAQ